jgi:hypothetical protein
MTDLAPTDPAPARARGWLRVGLSLLVTVAALALVQRRMDPLPDALTVAAWGVPAYLATLLVYAFARSARWWFLVRPLGQVRFADVLLAGLRVSAHFYNQPEQIDRLVEALP